MAHLLKSLARVGVIGLIVSTFILGTVTLGWRLKGGRILSVQTGSMVPTFRPGDAVLVEPVKPGQLRPGDIISYRSLQNAKLSVTHRLVAIDIQSGKLIVKGDRLANPDPPVPVSAVIGRVRWFVPKLGYGLAGLTRPIGLIVGIYLPAFIIISFEFKHFTKHYSKRSYRLDSYKN